MNVFWKQVLRRHLLSFSSCSKGNNHLSIEIARFVVKPVEIKKLTFLILNSYLVGKIMRKYLLISIRYLLPGCFSIKFLNSTQLIESLLSTSASSIRTVAKRSIWLSLKYNLFSAIHALNTDFNSSLLIDWSPIFKD